jgi:ABC-type glycerol-3-phosphate transport system permease component
MNIKQLFTKKKVSKLNEKSWSEKIVFLIAAIFMNFWAISLLFPLFFGINGALKEHGNAFMTNPVSIVLFKNPTWSNFAKAFKVVEYNEVSFIRMTFNSLYFATLPTLVALFFTTAVGYIVSKYSKYRIMKKIYSFILFIQFIPLYGTLPATYKLFSQLGFINSYSIIIASLGVSFGNFLYTYAFFKGVAWEYAESAFLDGAGHWRTFIQIMLPQIIPSLAVLFVGSFISTWNDFSTCMLYYSEKIPTLSFGIYAFE